MQQYVIFNVLKEYCIPKEEEEEEYTKRHKVIITRQGLVKINTQR